MNTPNSNSSLTRTIKNGINIFNQGKPGSTTEKIVNTISGPTGLNMSNPNNHTNDLGFHAANAIFR
jgi:hypothetical protein